jgi:hypothetical protein
MRLSALENYAWRRSEYRAGVRQRVCRHVEQDRHGLALRPFEEVRRVPPFLTRRVAAGEAPRAGAGERDHTSYEGPNEITESQ